MSKAAKSSWLGHWARLIVMEEFLSVMGYFDADEGRLLELLGRRLLSEFPNSTRSGCPPAEILKRIASHEMPLSEAQDWLDHLTSCSPCYRDFFQFQVASQS